VKPLMKSERQPMLPGFGVVEEIEKKRRFPQPRLGRFRPIKRYELLYHPLDQRFKGRLNAWLEKVQEDFPLEEVLPDYYLRMVRLYLYPQENGWWPNQGWVMAQLGEDEKATLRKPLIRALVRVWRRERHGPRAVEILKFEPEDKFIYQSIISYRLQEKEGSHRITTIDQLAACSAEDLRIICGARPMLEKLREKMQVYFPDWNPTVVFRQELPPEKA